MGPLGNGSGQRELIHPQGGHERSEWAHWDLNPGPSPREGDVITPRPWALIKNDIQVLNIFCGFSYYLSKCIIFLL